LVLNACGALPQTAAGENQPAVTSVINPTDIPTAVPTQAPSPTPVPALTVDDLKNATYHVKDFADMNDGSDSMTLVNGEYSKNQPAGLDGSIVFTLKYSQSAAGDLNGDGLADAAVILLADTGGSGTFGYLAAVINQDGKAVNVDTIALGDRTQIESLAVQGGTIALQMVTHGPQDPMCCPTLKVSETYLLKNNRLLTQAEKTAAPLAQGVIQALKAKDMSKLASFVHPTAGVRFSPYANVKDTDLVFTPNQLSNALQATTSYVWGSFDGSGAPIQMTFADYYARFVYSQDFASATQVGYNHVLSSGNTIDNSHDFYPNSIIVEYYLPGTDPSLGGMDWQSLRLVFQSIDNQWYLVGIIHSQWTI
jgi:hypothetical protein